MKKLDRSRPFDALFGVGENGERFKQDGVYFTHEGDAVGANVEDAAEPRAVKLEPAVEAPKQSLEDLAAGKPKATKQAKAVKAPPPIVEEDSNEVLV